VNGQIAMPDPVGKGIDDGIARCRKEGLDVEADPYELERATGLLREVLGDPDMAGPSDLALNLMGQSVAVAAVARAMNSEPPLETRLIRDYAISLRHFINSLWHPPGG
jgi:hypothetical protein